MMYSSKIKGYLWSLFSASLMLFHPWELALALPSPLLAQGTPLNSSEVLNPPQFLVDAVRWDLSIELGIHPDRFSVINATRESWPDTCLGLSDPGELCGQQITPGWRIILSQGNQTWAYRTDVGGQRRRLETLLQEIAFPALLSQQVLQVAAEQTQQPIDSLEIQQAIPQTWPDTCLGIDGNNCSAIAISGWQITISSTRSGQTWDYRTNDNGSMIRQASDRPATAISRVNGLPESVRQAVLKDLAQRRRLPMRSLEVLEATPERWSDNCLGIQRWNTTCTEEEVEGWRVVVGNQRHSWIYRTDAEGEMVYPERTQPSVN